jgi:membrane-associated protease RseP (regulator of RpoE activity)
MRTPEDIPNVVFAAAGVQRDLSRTVFSSKGPVLWKTEHYQDGEVQKPEVCAFNYGLPLLLPDGSVLPVATNGNSFAGPMFCGSIALMLSADPELLPWDLKEIITSTATDVGPEAVDSETGHGLINCYRAVKEVLRRKAIRENADPRPYQGRTPGDEIDIPEYQKELVQREVQIAAVRRNGPAMKAGIRSADVIIACNGTPIQSVKEWRLILRQAGKKEVKLLIGRNTKRLEFVVKADAPSLSRVRETYSSPVFR